MPIRVIAHVPERAAQVCLVDDADRLLIGRDSICGLRLQHPSVSRRHAVLQRKNEHWTLHEQRSKNGIRCNGNVVSNVILSRPQWLQLGDIYLECEPITESMASRLRQGERARRHDSQVLDQALEHAQGLTQLVRQGLHNLLTLAQCERGFILLLDDGEFRVCASEGLRIQTLGESRFEGSVGAVQTSLRESRSVICHDTRQTPWLCDRESIISGGIRALVSIPLKQAGLIIGAAYVDSQQAGRFFTELDIELIEAFTARMATGIAAFKVHDAIADMHAGLKPDAESAHDSWASLTACHDLRQE